MEPDAGVAGTPVDERADGVVGVEDKAFQHMTATTFWHPNGTPMSAQQFMEMLFGKLPEFFKNESELRALWSDPETRAKLLQGLSDSGFGDDQLAEMQTIIQAEKSDLFDVLTYVAYAQAPIEREIASSAPSVSRTTLAVNMGESAEFADPLRLSPFSSRR